MDLINTIGRRKTAVARVYLNEGKGQITINKIDYKEYFPEERLQNMIEQPIKIASSEGRFDIKVTIYGGGVTGQAEALRLAITRAIIKADPEKKPLLKSSGLLTRDPREVERKKPGQPKARKRFQFSKR
jgi:small subunit ribosomal protein S9